MLADVRKVKAGGAARYCMGATWLSPKDRETAVIIGGVKAMGDDIQAMSIFARLPMPDDMVLYDALIHASAHDGMRLVAMLPPGLDRIFYSDSGSVAV